MNADPFLRKFYCRHLQDYGSCLFGGMCLFSHSRSAYKVPDNVCLYNLKKSCRNPNCGASELITQLRVLLSLSALHEEPSTSRTSESERPTSAFKKKQRKDDEHFKRPPEIQTVHEERLCGICLEDVIDKKFGLLSNCDHIFCIDCIMTWRKTSEADTKNCPECRTPSLWVIPSRHYASGDEKKRLVDQFKMRRKEILCKFEKNGQNNCRQQETCLFKHNLPFKPHRTFERRPRYSRASYSYNASLILNTFFTDSSDSEDIRISILTDAFIR